MPSIRKYPFFNALIGGFGRRCHDVLGELQQSTRPKSPEVASKNTKDAVYVETGRVQEGPVSAFLQASGVINAKREVSLMGQRSGRIVRVAAEEGQSVKKGQVLGQLDNERESILLQRASLQLEKLDVEKARVKKLVAEKSKARKRLRT